MGASLFLSDFLPAGGIRADGAEKGGTSGYLWGLTLDTAVLQFRGEPEAVAFDVDSWGDVSVSFGSAPNPQALPMPLRWQPPHPSG